MGEFFVSFEVMGTVSFFHLIGNNLAQRCTHTHTSGGRGGGREQGQPATTNNGETKGQNNKGRKQAREHTTRRQNTGRKTGWHAEEQSAQSKTGNKAKPQQRENWSRTAQGRNKQTSKVWAGGEGFAAGHYLSKTKKPGDSRVRQLLICRWFWKKYIPDETGQKTCVKDMNVEHYDYNIHEHCRTILSLTNYIWYLLGDENKLNRIMAVYCRDIVEFVFCVFGVIEPMTTSHRKLSDVSNLFQLTLILMEAPSRTQCNKQQKCKNK